MFGASALWIALVPSASAVPSATSAACPDVEVVFARGTGEAPGPGFFGDAFVDSLRSKIGTKSMG
ncbi:MAG: cutinase family protein, partial [Mycobacterium sp.]